jgi:hypothetical protein
MNKIIISSIDSKSLRDNKYLDIFPEYYELSNITENNLWHDNQNVLDHVIGVFEELENILKFDKLKKNKSILLNKYLSSEVGGKTREDILKIAALLHDIAKKDTLVKKPDGTTSCPGHELMAASQVYTYSNIFGLNKVSSNYVERIVRYHGLISDFLTLIIVNKKRSNYLRMYKETVGDVDIELVLLMNADLLGCDLKQKDNKAFTDRLHILSWMLSELVKNRK